MFRSNLVGSQANRGNERYLYFQASKNNKQHLAVISGYNSSIQ